MLEDDKSDGACVKKQALSLSTKPSSSVLHGELILAFDYGTCNIGVAVGQKITRSATVLEPLHTKNLLWIKIDQLIKTWQPHILLVGVPCTVEGQELPRITSLAKDFIQQLQKRYRLPVYSVDERFTTKEARAKLFVQGGYRALHQESVDGLAAKIMLEEWLQTN